MSEPSLIYTLPLESHTFTNLLLINNSVQDHSVIVSAVNDSTFPIVYSNDSSKTELLELLGNHFSSFSRIALCFHSAGDGDREVVI